MHGSFERVGEAFLKNVTLWWGCAFTLAVYVAQVGGLGMIAIGLCYVVLARDGAMTSVTSAERMAPVLCAGGIIAEFVAGVAGYYAVAAVWPNFYYTPIRPEDHLAWTARRMHRHLRHRRHMRIRRHQARHACADAAWTHIPSGFLKWN